MPDAQWNSACYLHTQNTRKSNCCQPSHPGRNRSSETIEGNGGDAEPSGPLNDHQESNPHSRAVMNGHALSKERTASPGATTASEESRMATGGCTEMMPTMQQNDSKAQHQT
eukprot:7382551-Prymnesium_polylepis.1